MILSTVTTERKKAVWGRNVLAALLVAMFAVVATAGSTNVLHVVRLIGDELEKHTRSQV